MNALRQYIDLYTAHRELVDSHSAAPLNRLRPEALEALRHIDALPPRGAENYPLTDLRELLAPDYGINLTRVDIDANPAAAFRCDVPAVSTDLCFLVNDSFAKAAGALASLPEGVVAGSLRHIAATKPALVERFYGRQAQLANPLAALNTLLAQDGLMLYVPAGVRLPRPLQLVSLLSSGTPLMAVRRILVALEEGAEATVLVCDHTQTPDTDLMALQTVEISLGRGACLDYYDLEESSERTRRLSTLFSRQEADARLLVNGMTLYNGFTRNEYYHLLDGEGAEMNLYGLGITDRRRRVDMHSLIDHAAGRCRSEELFKFTADDEARCAFAGRILVRPGAAGTDSYQSNRNLLGSDTARIYSKPQLEIYNDDVKCSHGSATGQLDPTQLFYMRTRGIDEADARLLLKQAFMADVIDAVRLPGLRDRLRLLVERRFAGHDGACASCGVCQTPKSQS